MLDSLVHVTGTTRYIFDTQNLKTLKYPGTYRITEDMGCWLSKVEEEHEGKEIGSIISGESGK